jgi:azurin
MKNIILSLAVLTFSFALTACGGSDDAPATEEPGVAQITINSNDAMRFDTDRIEVRAGQTVELTLVHTGELPVDAMGHNWVLLASGTDVDAFSMEAMNAIETDYIPQDMYDQIIAYTGMLGGGERDTITFEAPEPGTYTFICSFPGHAGIMRGEFVVR